MAGSGVIRKNCELVSSASLPGTAINGSLNCNADMAISPDFAHFARIIQELGG